jgi:hypothetical protein
MIPVGLAQAVAFVHRTLWLVLCAALLTHSAPFLAGPVERVRRFTRPIEFEFVGWTGDALARRWAQSAYGSSGYLPAAERHDLVLEFLGTLAERDQWDSELTALLAGGGQPSQGELEAVRAGLAAIRRREAELEPLAEQIVQEQTSVVLADLGMVVGGWAFPPVAFHFTRLPDALIVSPREVIRQDASIQIVPDLGLEEHVRLEQEVERALGVSALVEPVGGIGTYPTMVQETNSLTFLLEVVAHEWIHNYLTLRPLGLLYDSTPELRTMNETAATLLGREIGSRTLSRYYPELVPPPPVLPSEDGSTMTAGPLPAPEPPAFDFRAEMHATRVEADRLLAEGRIEEAEAYMEARRHVLWEHGYRIRRLNQAYFAFHGAYADEPEGPAGEDPVGDAVRELWRRSASPREFLVTIAWMNDYGDLLAALDRPGAGPTPLPTP